VSREMGSGDVDGERGSGTDKRDVDLFSALDLEESRGHGARASTSAPPGSCWRAVGLFHKAPAGDFGWRDAVAVFVGL
jgi:hypothetical protein